MESRNVSATKIFDFSNAGAKTNLCRWGVTCLSAFFVGVTINIGLGNRTSASVPIYISVTVIHVLVSIILIKGILSDNRRFVSIWLWFAAFNLILLNIIYIWLNLSRQMRTSFMFLALANIFGIFFWFLTYSYYLTMTLTVDVMFLATQVHM